MAYFKDAQELYDVMGVFLTNVTADPELRPKFAAARTSFIVNLTDPAARILVDCTQDPPVVVTDPPEGTPAEINLTMTADDGHRFWCGKLNVTLALAKKQVVVSGALAKMMKLLPALKPAFGRYREFLAETGHADKVP